MRIAILGAGGWGTALAIVAGRAGHEVRLWSRNAGVVESINSERVNAVYLAGHEIAGDVRATVETGEAVEGAELVVLAAPSHATRELLRRVAGDLRAGATIVSATKGVEIETGQRISEIARGELGEGRAARFVCLSGPSFAQEVAAGHPTAVVAASRDAELARLVQSAFSSQNLRVYTNDDLIGVELGGAVKNVIALAAGMVAGLGLGANSVAALVTRGLSEIVRLAVAEGGRVETLTGLAGLGDLVLTCTGSLSRNRRVGQELGRGRALAEITGEMREVAEGVRTTRAVWLLAARRRHADHGAGARRTLRGQARARGRGRVDGPAAQRRVRRGRGLTRGRKTRASRRLKSERRSRRVRGFQTDPPRKISRGRLKSFARGAKLFAPFL